MCASWHCNPVFNRGLGLVLFELIELIQRINVSSPTEQHIMAAEHVCWVVHSLVYCASGARTMLCLLAMLRWRILGWRRLRETSFRRFESRLKWWQRGPREGRMNLTEYLGRDDRQVEQMIGVARLQFDSEHGRDVEWFYRRVYKLERVRYLGWCRPKDQQYQWKCQFPILGELRISRRSWKTRDSIGAAADVRGCWVCDRSSKNRSVHECEVYHGWRGMTMKGPPDRRKVQDGAGDENVKPKEKGDTSAKSIGNSSYPQTHFQGRCRHCGRKVTTCQTAGARNNVPSKISDGLSSSKGKSFKKESASCKWRRRFRKQSYNTSQYWTFLGLWDEKKCNGTLLLYTPEGKWDSKTAQMVERMKGYRSSSFQEYQCFESWNLDKRKTTETPYTSMRMFQTPSSCYGSFILSVSSVFTEQFRNGVNNSAWQWKKKDKKNRNNPSTISCIDKREIIRSKTLGIFSKIGIWKLFVGQQRGLRITVRDNSIHKGVRICIVRTQGISWYELRNSTWRGRRFWADHSRMPRIHVFSS